MNDNSKNLTANKNFNIDQHLESIMWTVEELYNDKKRDKQLKEYSKYYKEKRKKVQSEIKWKQKRIKQLTGERQQSQLLIKVERELKLLTTEDKFLESLIARIDNLSFSDKNRLSSSTLSLQTTAVIEPQPSTSSEMNIQTEGLNSPLTFDIKLESLLEKLKKNEINEDHVLDEIENEANKRKGNENKCNFLRNSATVIRDKKAPSSLVTRLNILALKYAPLNKSKPLRSSLVDKINKAKHNNKATISIVNKNKTHKNSRDK